MILVEETKIGTKGSKRKWPSQDESHAWHNDQADNPNTEPIQCLKLPTCGLLSLPFELHSLIVSLLMVEKVKAPAEGMAPKLKVNGIVARCHCTQSDLLAPS